MTAKIPKKRIAFSTAMFAVMTGVSLLCFEFLGMENNLVSIMVVVQCIMVFLARLDENPAALAGKILALNLCLCILAGLADMNIWLGLVINFGVFFWGPYLLFRDRGMQIYYPFMLNYIYMMVGHPLTFGHMSHRIIIVVCGAVIVGLLQIIVYKKVHNKEENPEKAAIRHNFMKPGPMDTKSLRFSFAFRLALGVTLMWLVVKLFDIEYGKWLIISTHSIIMPTVPAAATKITKRISGNLVGFGIFFVIFALVPSLKIRLLMVAIAGYCSLYFMNRYEVRAACFSFMSLSAISFTEPAGIGFVFRRPVFVIAGSLFAMTINLLILRHDKENTEDI